jgi:hypothetical protein
MGGNWPCRTVGAEASVDADVFQSASSGGSLDPDITLTNLAYTRDRAGRVITSHAFRHALRPEARATQAARLPDATAPDALASAHDHGDTPEQSRKRAWKIAIGASVWSTPLLDVNTFPAPDGVGLLDGAGRGRHPGAWWSARAAVFPCSLSSWPLHRARLAAAAVPPRARLRPKMLPTNRRSTPACSNRKRTSSIPPRRCSTAPSRRRRPPTRRSRPEPTLPPSRTRIDPACLPPVRRLGTIAATRPMAVEVSCNAAAANLRRSAGAEASSGAEGAAPHANAAAGRAIRSRAPCRASSAVGRATGAGEPFCAGHAPSERPAVRAGYPAAARQKPTGARANRRRAPISVLTAGPQSMGAETC